MTGARHLPCGSWPSPLTAGAIAAGGLRLSEIWVDGSDTYWIEGRAAEAGRSVIVRRRPDGSTADALPAPYSARSLVHEYGGGAMAVHEGDIYFVNAADQRIHRLVRGQDPVPLTPETSVRFADMRIDSQRQRLLTVLEDHRTDPVANSIAAVPLGGGDPQLLVGGNDFYSSPRLSGDGQRLAWMTWNQPLMPWEGSELWVADVSDGGDLVTPRRIAGSVEESIFQPEWSPEGELHFVSDRTGWSNLYRWSNEEALPIAPMEAECGRPQWVFGLATYAFLGAETVALCSCRNGVWSLLSVDRRSGAITRVDTPFTDLGHYLAAERGRVFVDAGGPTQPLAIVSIEMATGDVEVVRSSTAVPLDPGSVSKYRSVTFASGVERASGDSPGEATAHGFFYAPRLDSVQPLEDERPPLLVRAHGGPTSAASTALDPIVQYWTSRGIAVLDVNYGGSTGYGRDYRRRLDGEWGVVDVADCVAGARALAERGDVDGSRLLITGGSAGGFVVLCALAFHETFAAGASHYGVADIETLARDTHKFEARYFDGLIGPYPGCADLYRKRSPIHSVENINSPVILFQGVDDLIVPANQAETMFAALRARGMVCAYLAFPGEQHGFRQRSTIEKVMEAELYFYARVLGFEVPAELQPIDIVNL